VTQSTILSSGTINGGDTLTIEVIRPDSMPAVVRIVWPTAATITTPAHYREVASVAMRLLAEASTTLARNPSEPTALTDLERPLASPGQLPARSLPYMELSKQEMLALPINTRCPADSSGLSGERGGGTDGTGCSNTGCPYRVSVSYLA
jgi:hypothetical protein